MYKVAILMEGGSGDKAAAAEEEATTTPVFLHCLIPFQKILLQLVLMMRLLVVLFITFLPPFF
jgi:hypothetical protein